MKPITEIEQRRLRRRVHDAIADIDAMKAQLADIRRCCQEMSQLMREIRENGEQAREDMRRRQSIKRVI
jgi:multidrug resistance efflux pump